MPEIATIKIHPGIGIARVGNVEGTTEADYFIGPRIPGLVETPPGGYKRAGKIKRQAAEFRLFAYDAEDNLLGEITNEDAHIEWTVELANKKSSWRKFAGLNPNAAFRNEHIEMPEERAELNISPPPKSVAGDKSEVKIFNEGSFTDRDESNNVARHDNIHLGEILTDGDGRLHVLGGKGLSASPANRMIGDYANNPGWFDDTADGPVDARVELKNGGGRFDAVGSWVICTLPKFAPQLHNIVTLHDLLIDVATKSGQIARPRKPKFYRDIVPILERMYAFRWLLSIGPIHDQIYNAAKDPAANANTREDLFVRLRSPKAANNGPRMNMPMLWDDNNEWDRQGPAGFHLTDTQYRIMKQWKDGQFETDSPTEAGGDSMEITPPGLDKAALENCCGGAFFPGMEVSWFVRDVFRYSEPFRLDRRQPMTDSGRLEAGDVTKQMAVPWQADFLACTSGARFTVAWWPQQRPDFVLEQSGGPDLSWIRGKARSYEDMVERWSELGFILKDGDSFLEKERNPDAIA